MRLNLLSDIHLEQIYDVNAGIRYLEAIRPVETADVLILAGDIWSLSDEVCLKYLDEFRKWAIEIIMVPGNHEYYNTNPEIQGKYTLTLLEQEGLRVLGPRFRGSFSYNDGIKTVKFVGTTAWYPYNKITAYKIETWSDCSHIKNFRNWWKEYQLEERKMLWSNVEEGCVVITHMLPTWGCIDEKFLTDSHNCLYVSDLEDLLIEKKPAIWAHGHSHEPLDMIIGSTRCIRNPIGYPSYITDISSIKILEIDI